MRLSLVMRVCVGILSLATGLAGPAAGLAHGFEHTRFDHDDHHDSGLRTNHTHLGENPGQGAVGLGLPADQDHPHHNLVSTTCYKITLRLLASVVPDRGWSIPVNVGSSQRAVPPEQSSWIDPPLTRTSQPRAPPHR